LQPTLVAFGGGASDSVLAPRARARGATTDDTNGNDNGKTNNNSVGNGFTGITGLHGKPKNLLSTNFHHSHGRSTWTSCAKQTRRRLKGTYGDHVRGHKAKSDADQTHEAKLESSRTIEDDDDHGRNDKTA